MCKTFKRKEKGRSYVKKEVSKSDDALYNGGGSVMSANNQLWLCCNLRSCY